MEYKITLRAARINAGMHQSAVAGKLGVSKESIANWERGKVPLKATVLLQLCQLYGIPIDNILLPQMFDLNERNRGRGRGSEGNR